MPTGILDAHWLPPGQHLLNDWRSRMQGGGDCAFPLTCYSETDPGRLFRSDFLSAWLGRTEDTMCAKVTENAKSWVSSVFLSFILNDILSTVLSSQ